MKIKVFAIFACVIFMLGTIATAEITPFDYTFSIPTSADLTKEQAEAIADAYFSSKSDRIVIYHEDITQYEKATNFIRIARQGEPMYCWVVAYNDGKNVWSGYGFVGMVIVSSPDGRIVEWCSDYYLTCFNSWNSTLVSNQRSLAEALGARDLIALPSECRFKHVMPDINSIREEEALKIANRLVAGYQHIAEDDVELKYDIACWLSRDLLVTDVPFWTFRYTRYKDIPSETPILEQMQYTVVLYAHTGSVWYVIEHPEDKVIYADLSYCNLPLSEESFDPYEWEYSNYRLLFQ